MNSVISKGNPVSSMTILNSIMAASIYNESQLTSEEKQERAIKRRNIENEQARQSKILKNICPTCNSKLVRGKRDKTNEYKRIWTCKMCDEIHNL